MADLGYITSEDVSTSHGYYKYHNKHAVIGNTYGPMPVGKRIISINASEFGGTGYVFVGIKEDGGTRTAFAIQQMT